jgi:hypothetical protein
MAGDEFDHSPGSSIEIKNKWSSTSATLYVFMAWLGNISPLFYFFLALKQFISFSFFIFHDLFYILRYDYFLRVFLSF